MKNIQANIEKAVENRALYDNVNNKYLIIKRIFDILASFFGIIILLPLFLLLSILIKMESSGTVFFAQERVGYKGIVFKMYKFRSMVSNAEVMLKDIEDQNEVSGHMFKIKDDPRVTRIGRFIRRTSIDELPQLFNVLRGEMSMVGPRPPLIREVVSYAEWHNLRMSVRPGITGLWQIRGRSSLGFEEMVRLDLKYIRERSFWYDMKIIFRTIPVLFGNSEAY